MKKNIISASILILVVTCSILGIVCCGGNKEKDEVIMDFAPMATPKPDIFGTNGMVVAAGPISASSGLKVLQDGGNAFDALITVAALLTLEQPMNCGIGGHGIGMFYSSKTGKLTTLDFGGGLPKKFTIDQWGTPPEIPGRGLLATILPGTLKGWDTILKAYGTISIADALAPAIHYAEKGVPFRPDVIGTVDYLGGVKKFELYPELAKALIIDGRIPEIGDLLKRPDLAKSYELIAERGADVFYKGELGDKIIKFLNDHGSRFTKEEFENYEPVWREVISTKYRDEYEVFVPKAQVSSPQILTLLNIWENYDFSKIGNMSADYVHIMVESLKFAIANRANFYGDPEFSDIPFDMITSKSYGKKIANGIDMNKSKDREFWSNRELGKGHTTHFCVVDKEGNIAAITQTLGNWFGAIEVVPGTGITLNNEGIFFDLTPEDGPNYPEAGKKSQHDMSPTLVFMNGKPYMAVGTPGGEAIPQIIAQVIHKIIDFGMTPQQAIDEPRFVDGGVSKGGFGNMSKEEYKKLLAKGHRADDLIPIEGKGNCGVPAAIIIDEKNDVLLGGINWNGIVVGY
ncbi:gamma-glutamyltransferase family protein [Acidobacteriota bacterium]